MSEPRPRCQLPANQGVSTYAVRGGQQRTEFDEMAEPISLTQGFVYEHAGDAAAAFAGDLNRFTYSRYGNPTVSAFEEGLRLMGGAEACFGTAKWDVCHLHGADATAAPGCPSGRRPGTVRNHLHRSEHVARTSGVHTDCVDAHDLDYAAGHGDR